MMRWNMDTDYIQNLRYKLQKRFRKVNAAEYQIFHYSLKQFWGFLESYTIFVGIMEDLERKVTHLDSEADSVINDQATLVFDNELENVGLSYLVLRKCVESQDQNQEIVISHNYSGETNHNDALEFFKEFFVETFYDFIDEQIDDQRAILSILLRYKKKCEWFQRDNLFNLWENNTQIGEKLLAFNLYEYLFDQGIDFIIEPTSFSGKIDLISAQSGEERLLADVKIFNPNKSKGIDYISKGFNQIYIYTLDYNESFGYLIIFKTCGEDLRFSLPNKEQTIPFVWHNNKTIFFLTIDIFPHNTSASKRGKLKTIEITENNLINYVKGKRD